MPARPRPFFERDGITIFLADCRNVLPSLPAESVDFALTDPPYLVSYKGRWELGQEHIVGDDDPSWLLPSFAEIYRTLKPDCSEARKRSNAPQTRPD
jgi:DNA modification methylase